MSSTTNASDTGSPSSSSSDSSPSSASTTARSGSWTSFLKSIASFNGDLSSLTAPPFILSPTSLVEYSQYWAEHPDLLVAPNELTTTAHADNDEIEAMSLKRMIAVTKWFISTLKSQYCSRNESMGSEKKPLNPFLGEVFVGKWESEKLGETFLLSEQVSHHPPVTAYAIENPKHNIILQGYNGITSSISTSSINIKQYGHALLDYKDLEENYLVTLPPLHIEGLITAAPFVELEGTSYIQASNGYFAVIDYSGRGWVTGKKNTFKARIFRDQVASSSKENALVTISGQWSSKSYIGKGGSTPNSKHSPLFYDAKASKAEHLKVKPIEEQQDFESRKAWQKVAEAIKKSDYNLISYEKSLIENHQRELRKKEREAGTKWQTRWFDLVDYNDDNGETDSNVIQPDEFINLTNLANLSIHNAPSGSLKKSKYDQGEAKHWRFNKEKWENDDMNLKVLQLVKTAIFKYVPVIMAPASDKTIVIGSGLAGLTATLELISQNHKVILLEKTDKLGGNSAKASSGINGVPTIYQHNDDTVEIFKEDTLKSGKGLSNVALVDKLTTQSSSAIEWLTKDLQVDLSSVAQLGGHSFARTHKGAGKLPPGFAIIKGITTKIEELQSATPEILTILKNSQLEKILYEDHRIQGVQYKDLKTDKVDTIFGDNLILATGGFSADFQSLDTSLLQKYRPDLLKFPTSNGQQTTGDGQKIAERDVDAELIHMDQIQVHPTGFINLKDVTSKWKFLCGEVMRGIGGVLLSPQGSRFTDELSTRNVVTSAILHNCEIKRENEYGFPIGSFASILVISEDDYPKAKNHIDFYEFQGLLKKGSVNDLLEILHKIDPVNTALTIEDVSKTFVEYNNAISKDGGDGDVHGRKVFGSPFGKQFYFGLTTPVLHFAMGGIKIDEHARVIDKQGNTIENLYAIGEVSGGLHGGNRLGGSSLLESVVFGKEASHHINSKSKSE
ncbi:KES1 [Candida oxycetoniae]|uniref:KES1 n=1 Tax=Candida oxycetoniae TaxID=497107 RepID=A0AAI9WXC3_9ASCO|nr:KES1 [Candida oxycetoniae]KAI3403610.2 KES1 [Candida oxycetoniae]